MPRKTLTPQTGGKLVTAPGEEVAGITNYTVKQNFRRVFGREETIEGWDVHPDNAGNFPENVNLFHDAKSPFGDHENIACTATTLYKWNRFALTWDAIGTGFDPAAHRWEAEDVNGYTVFNNGSDLPVTYRVGDAAVTPIYEMRERGFISCGCMTNLQGYIVFTDIIELKSTELSAFLNSPAGKVIPGGDAYSRLVDFSITERIPYRLLWPHINEPRRWAVSLVGTILIGTSDIVLTTPTEAFVAGDQVNIGTIVNANILFISLDKRTLTIDQVAPVTFTAQPVVKADNATLLAGFLDVFGDGSHIRRVKKLRNRMVIYRDTGIWLASTTADPNDPIIAEETYTGFNNLWLRWSLVSIEDNFHVFWGKSSDGEPRFYKYSLLMRVPEIMGDINLVRDEFSGVTRAEEESVVGNENLVTKEIWFCLPANKNKTVVFDYENEDVFTMDATFNAIGNVTDPRQNQPIQATDTWFLMGTHDGRILLNGHDESGTRIYKREGASYQAILKSGVSPLTDAGSESRLLWVLLIPSSKTDNVNCPVVYTVFSGNFPGGLTQAGTRTFTDLSKLAKYPVSFQAIYFQDQIAITVDGKSCSMGGRVFEWINIGSNAVVRM